jgi:hypothetical protein
MITALLNVCTQEELDQLTPDEELTVVISTG